MTAPAPDSWNGVPTPPLTFTVAITGQRDILPDRWAPTRDAVAAILSRCRSQLEAGVAGSRLDSGRILSTRFITALACGADQIGAEAALRSGSWELDVLLPFQRQAYLRSLRDNLPDAVPDRSGALLGQASSVLELADWRPSGAREEAVDGYWRNRRYRTIGQMLAQRADFVIAVWRGDPPAGPGGTATVMGEAHRIGLPILWIDPDTGVARAIPPNRLTANENILKVAKSAKPGAKAVGALIAAAIKPTLVPDDGPGSVRPVASLAAFTNRLDLVRPPGRLRKLWRLLLRPLSVVTRNGPAGTTEPVKAKTRAFAYQLFQWAILFLARKQGGGALRSWAAIPIATDGGVAIWSDPARDEDNGLRDFAVPADLIATRRGHIYRSTYILIFALVAAAIGACLFSLFAEPDSKWLFVIAELAMLLLIIILYATASRLEWHARWINARHIVESLRGIRLMVWCGSYGRRPPDEKRSWSGWFANAVAASIVPRHRRITAQEVSEIAADVATVVEDQRTYHLGNHERLERFHKRLERLGVFAVGFAIAIAILFLLVFAITHHDPAWHDETVVLKTIATVAGGFLPAVTAAFASIRYHGDFERFAERSLQTSKQLTLISARIVRLRREARNCGSICKGGPPLYEDLLDICLATQAIFEDDLHDWRFVYAARPMPGL